MKLIAGLQPVSEEDLKIKSREVAAAIAKNKYLMLKGGIFLVLKSVIDNKFTLAVRIKDIKQDKDMVIDANNLYTLHDLMYPTPRTRAKLTWYDIEEIRKSHDSDLSLAEKYKVHRTTITRIRLGEIWKET